MVSIGSNSGRLVRSLNKEVTNSFWWMGARCCDVQVGFPEEVSSPAVQRRVPRTRRGTKKRGRRTGRIRIVKRALVRRALPNSVVDTSVSVNGRSRRFKLEDRKDNYSRALIEKFKSLRGTVSKMWEGHRDASLWSTGRERVYNRLRARLREVKASWIRLASARYPDESAIFRQAKFRLLVDGIDKCFSRLPRSALREINHGAVQSPARYLNSDGISMFRCLSCNRDTPIKVCRICGRELAPHGKRKHPAMGKARVSRK